ncbi:unnamed protein product [Soboliphyme baturini]|uniref:Reelin domain-containing protein n=1 Tax=Soboliphyme baturini TaxID=241478 RepID=A0A183IFG4_9BILA|nr:unnamed protein product [Soboliphyme baturini]
MIIAVGFVVSSFGDDPLDHSDRMHVFECRNEAKNTSERNDNRSLHRREVNKRAFVNDTAYYVQWTPRTTAYCDVPRFSLFRYGNGCNDFSNEEGVGQSFAYHRAAGIGQLRKIHFKKKTKKRWASIAPNETGKNEVDSLLFGKRLILRHVERKALQMPSRIQQPKVLSVARLKVRIFSEDWSLKGSCDDDCESVPKSFGAAESQPR